MRLGRAFFAALLLLSAPALAADPRAPTPAPTIDFTQLLPPGPDGKAPFTCVAAHLPDGTCPETGRKPMTLSDAAVSALGTDLPEDRALSPLAKFQNDDLARAIYNNHAVALSPENLVTIKDRIGKAYGSTVVGSAWRALGVAPKGYNLLIPPYSPQ